MGRETSPALQDFAASVREGFSSCPKRIPSRFLYDAEGDRLFQEIMHLPDYYPARSEFEILSQNQAALLAHLPDDSEGFELVELGAGDGLKTKQLLRYLAENGPKATYRPIDISQNVLDELAQSLAQEMPDFDCQPLQGEYFEVLQQLGQWSKRPKLVLFLGSNLGNLSDAHALDFLKQLRQNLQSGDRLLIGLDLVKAPEVILAAYNDRQGITAAFNRNLLKRINRELGGNFQLQHFSHYPLYEPEAQEARSYLVSLREQEVFVEALNETFHFGAYEAIHVEISRKYTLDKIGALARKSGFTVEENLMDCKHYFTDSLWRAC